MEIQINEQTLETILIDSQIRIIKSPTAEYIPNSNVGIESISIDDNYTKIDFVYISPKEYPNLSWVLMHGDAYIRPVGTENKYKLIKAINIPLAPNKHFFQKSGQVLKYTLLFPALPRNIKQIDIIEKLIPGPYFNFFRVNISHGQPLLITFNNNQN
jgi:hypothetical protein